MAAASHIPLELVPHRLVVGLFRRPEHEPGAGPVRDDVRGRAALLDDPVDARRRSSCCRHSPTELNRSTIASRAFLPIQGSDDAWACRPVNTTSMSSDASGPALDVAPVAGVVQQGRIEALEEPVLDHRLLAAAAFLGRAAEEDDLARQLVGDRRPARSPHRRPTRPSCCGRSRGRAPAGRRIRRGCRSAARRRHGRPASRPGSPSRGCPPAPGRRTRAARGPRRPRPPRGAPRRPAPDRHGSDGKLEDLGAGCLDGGREARLRLDVGLGGANGGQCGHGSSGTERAPPMGGLPSG